MGLHKFNANKANKKLRLKNSKNKYIKYGSLIVSVILFVSMIIYFSYSKYTISNKYNVMQATVGDFSSAKSLSDYLISIQSTNTSTTATSDYAKLGNGFVKITYLGTTLK